MTRLTWPTLLAALVLVVNSATSRADVRATKHNLSVSGPGPLRAYGERQICVFCHTPHTARQAAPLWNRRDSGRAYIKYWSPTLDAYGPGEAPPIGGASRLCLSCHDGTVALGDLSQGGPVRMLGGGERILPRGEGFSGTNLSGSHPISFRVTSALIERNNARDLPLRPLAAMKSDPDVRLDREDKLQCTTCHTVHDDKHRATSGVGFYRKPTWDGVCTICHAY